MGHCTAPGSSAIVVFIAIVVVISATAHGRVSLKKDTTHVKVTKLHRPVPQPTSPPPAPPHGKEGSTTLAPAGLPPSSTPTPTPIPIPWSSLELDVTLGGTAVHLKLQEDSEFEPDVPVLELYTNGEGREQIRRPSLGKAEYSVYHDEEKEADFIVFREKDEYGTLHYKLEGTVHVGGNVYGLKTTGRRLTHRRRRETSQTEDNVTEDVSHDDNNQEEEEEEEEEEVEVIRYSEMEADQTDSLPNPNVPQKTKVMTETVDDPLPASLLLLPLPSSPTPSPPSTGPPLPLPPALKRRKREVTQDVYVDVVALADYGVYTSWYNRSNRTTALDRKQDALENIRRYYAFVMNGVGMLYKNISSLSYKIHVKLTTVVVATTAASSNWTEGLRVNASLWDEVNANQALHAVSSWAASTDQLPSYDHLMLFSGYDLTKVTTTGSTSNTITGLAYTSTLCDTNGMASSIVEDLGGFQCIGTAAHELGHGLSAEHDGTNNDCNSLDRYVMAAGTYPVTSDNKLNPWKFSSCSISYFNNFISSTVRLSRGQTCLYMALATSSNIPNVTSQLAGQLYDVDKQCRQVYGPQSRMCRGPVFGEASEVCTGMFCYDPTTVSTCYQLKAARGTTCGNYKWCESGQCVSNVAAPPADENCVHGDTPGMVFNTTTCADFVANFPGYCYQEVVRTRCCASCAKHYRLVKDCEYGDKAINCQTTYCPSAPPDYLVSCCGTCDYGTTFTTTAATTVSIATDTVVTQVPPTTSSASTTAASTTAASTTAASTSAASTTAASTSAASTSAASTTAASTTAASTSAASTTAASTTAASTTAASTTAASTSAATTNDDACNDGNVIINGTYDCPAFVNVQPSACYNASLISLCCLSCQEANTGVRGCEYGDRNSGSCSSMGTSSCGQYFTDGSSYSQFCCATCGYVAPTTTTTTSTTPPTTTTTVTTTTPIPTTTTATTVTSTSPTTATSTTTPTTATTTTTTATTTTTQSTTTATTTTTSSTTTATTPSTTTTTAIPPTTTAVTSTSTTSSAPVQISTHLEATTRIIPSSTTTTTPTTTTTSTPAATSTPNDDSSVAPSTLVPERPCLDVTSSDGSACAVVSRDRSRCYDASVLARCCFTCTSLADASSRGCEYGDRPGCNVILPNSDACSTQQPLCCKTCAGYVRPSGGHSVTAYGTVYVIGACVSLALLLWT